MAQTQTTLRDLMMRSFDVMQQDGKPNLSAPSVLAWKLQMRQAVDQLNGYEIALFRPWTILVGGATEEPLPEITSAEELLLTMMLPPPPLSGEEQVQLAFQVWLTTPEGSARIQLESGRILDFGVYPERPEHEGPCAWLERIRRVSKPEFNRILDQPVTVDI